MTRSTPLPPSVAPVPQAAADVLAAPTCALVLWDLQYGLGGQAPTLPELTPVWARLRDAALEAGVLVVRSHHVPPPVAVMDDVERWRISRRTHGANRPETYLIPGTHDADYLEGFTPGPDELVVDKTAPSLFHGTNVDQRLRARGIRTVVLAGVATDIGIDFTARHAMALGYFPVICEDGTAAFTDAAHQHAMALLRSFTFVADSDEIIRCWAERP